MALPDPSKIDIGDGRTAEIRPAEPSDAGGWIALMSAVAAEGRYIAVEHVSMNKRNLARYLRTWSWSNEGAAIAAVEGRNLVGQLSLHRDRGIYAHGAELGMSVAASHRRVGIGSALIEGAIDWCKAFGVEKLNLLVFPHNERALSLYRKLGFEHEGLRKRHAKLSYGYEDLAEMSLWLGR